MTGTAAGSSQLSIGRLNSVYLVAHDHPAPDRLRSQLDQTMRTRLAEACARWLSTVLDPADPAVWLIRRVELDLALDAGGLDEETLAQAWSRGIAMAVVRAIEFGPDGHSVRYFPDRAAYLAYFLGELLDGRAWGRWYLAGFESLRSLPTGTAAAEALVREPQWAEPALVHLAAQGRLERLLDLLPNRDAARILDACVPPTALAGADDLDRAVIDAVLTRWSELAPRLRRTDWPHTVRTLLIVLDTRRRFPELAPGAVRLAAERLSGLTSLLAQNGLTATALASLAVADLDAALAAVRQSGVTVGLENLAAFVRLARGDAAWLAGVLGAARAGAPQSRPTTRRSPAHEIIATPVAGLFVLVPFLRDVAWPAVLASAPEELDTAQALCYLLCLKLCGRPRSQVARFDPALLAAAGLDHPPAADDLARGTLTGAAGLGVLVSSLAQSGLADLRCLHVEIVEQGGTRSLLLRETARGDWLYAAPLVDPPQAVLDKGLALITAAAHAPDVLLVDALSAAEFDTAALRARGLSLLDPADLPVTESLPVATADLAAYLARSRSSEPEVAYFSLSGLLPTVITQSADDSTWSVVARAALRAFTRQLLGFRDSSTPFVWENFLGGVGQVQLGSGRIDVRLPPSPLRMMLRLAGLASLTYTVPWLEDTEIHVSLPEE